MDILLTHISIMVLIIMVNVLILIYKTLQKVPFEGEQYIYHNNVIRFDMNRRKSKSTFYGTRCSDNSKIYSFAA